MVNDKNEHTPKAPAKQAEEAVIRKPMKIGACTPYDFQGSNLTVPVVNSDRIDKLGVVAHSSFAFRTRSNRLSRLSGRLVSDPRHPAVGDPGVTSSDRRSPALRPAPQTDPG